MNWKSVAISAALALGLGAIVAGAVQTNYLGVVFVADPTTVTRQLVVNSDGSINATVVSGGGVPSIAGTANQITETGSPGATTLSIPSDFRPPGTLLMGALATFNYATAGGASGIYVGNSASNATLNMARIYMGPTSDFDLSAAPYFEAYNPLVNDNTGFRWYTFNGTRKLSMTLTPPGALSIGADFFDPGFTYIPFNVGVATASGYTGAWIQNNATNVTANCARLLFAPSSAFAVGGNESINPYLQACNTAGTNTTSFTFQTYNGGAVAAANLSAAGDWTVAGTLTATLGHTSQANILCYNSGTGLVTYSTVVEQCTVSSARFKYGVSALADAKALRTVSELEPVSFLYRPEADMGTDKHVGLIAEQVQKVDPELVTYEADGVTPKTVKYGELYPIIIGAIRQLKADNDNLRSELNDIRASRR